jgi:hypothetical protein
MQKKKSHGVIDAGIRIKDDLMHMICLVLIFYCREVWQTSWKNARDFLEKSTLG